AEISWSFRRDLGRSWRKTSLACCCDQTWKETRRFSNRQVSTKGTEKAQSETLTYIHLRPRKILRYGPLPICRASLITLFRWPLSCSLELGVQCLFLRLGNFRSHVEVLE